MCDSRAASRKLPRRANSTNAATWSVETAGKGSPIARLTNVRPWAFLRAEALDFRPEVGSRRGVGGRVHALGPVDARPIEEVLQHLRAARPVGVFGNPVVFPAHV